MREIFFSGWNIITGSKSVVKRSIINLGRSGEARAVAQRADNLATNIASLGMNTSQGRRELAQIMAERVVTALADGAVEPSSLAFTEHLADYHFRLIGYEQWFELPSELYDSALEKTGGWFAQGGVETSVLWEIDDCIKEREKFMANFDDMVGHVAQATFVMLQPIVQCIPSLLETQADDESKHSLAFSSPLSMAINEFDQVVERMIELPFVPEFDESPVLVNTRDRLNYNLLIASGANPAGPSSYPRNLRTPTRFSYSSPEELLETYLKGTPLLELFDYRVDISVPEEARFEHHHIVAGSGHGKTQTLQHLILHDLQAVSQGNASLVVLDSQGDLIKNISGLSVFAPDGPLSDKLIVIDPTDVEYPVALNLFDVGIERINEYSQLDREKLINGVLELYDFVLGSLLDAQMTQKQSVIFRYITRLLLHIPDATIITLRELLEEDGSEKYREYINTLQGSARAFFETEFDSREFTQTKKQVLRRLWGILENQSFERMFLHPKNKLDLFSEMNRGKVILINTAKDLLKEDGTQIFGRFFIAMIAQAAQERAVIAKDKRMPTFVYIDEAQDYFDRNIEIILSQARKYKVGMILAHQYLGQLDSKLQEAFFSNTSIKFAGGVSSKDARAFASEMKTDAPFIETQDKLSFAAYVRGTTKKAVSLSVTYGQMERLPTMSGHERLALREKMRAQFATHYTEAGQYEKNGNYNKMDGTASGTPNDEPSEWK